MYKYLRFNENSKHILLGTTIKVRYKINELAVRITIRVRVKLINSFGVTIEQHSVLIKISIKLSK